MKRRGFLAGILAAGMAPAYVGASVLMPVRKIVAPPDLHDMALAAARDYFSLSRQFERHYERFVATGSLRIYSPNGRVVFSCDDHGVVGFDGRPVPNWRMESV